MNNRIKELAEQADLYARSDNSSKSFVNYKKLYTEKFAELIVSECMSKIQEVKEIKVGIDAGPDYTQGFDDGMFVAIRTVEEHFGIEE